MATVVPFRSPRIGLPVQAEVGIDAMDSLRARLRATEAALDQVCCAVFIVDADSVVQFANAAARRIAAGGDGLVLVGRRLGVTVSEDASRLRELIAKVAAASARRNVRSRAHALAIRRTIGRTPLYAVALLAPGDVRAGKPQVLLHAVDPSAHRRASIGLLREALGLTDREIGVALATLRLGSVPAAAAGLGVALTTARTHLQHVFDKTGTRNQVALAQMFAVLDVLPATDIARGSPE